MSTTEVLINKERVERLRQIERTISAVESMLSTLQKAEDRRLDQGENPQTVTTFLNDSLSDIESILDEVLNNNKNALENLDWRYAERLKVNPEHGFDQFVLSPINAASSLLAVSQGQLSVFVTSDVVQFSRAEDSANRLHASILSVMNVDSAMINASFTLNTADTKLQMLLKKRA